MEIKKPSVLFIAGTLGQGGAERQLFLLARSLKQNGHRVGVISLTSGEYWEQPLLEEGITVFPNKKKRTRLGKLLWIWQTNQSFTADIVYSFHFYTSIYSGLLRYMSFGRALSVGSIRGNGLDEIEQNGKWSYWQMALNHLIIANNEHGRSNIISNLNIPTDKIQIVGNAIEVNSIKKAIPTITEPLRLLFAGRFDAEKDPLKFIEICHILYEEGLPFWADMYGGGPLRQVVEEQIIDLGLNAHIHLKGKVPNVSSLFSDYHILISTSLHEGTPNVVLEGILAGCLIVSRSFAGITDLLTAIDPNYEKLIWNTAEEAVSFIQQIVMNSGAYASLQLRGKDWVEDNFRPEEQYNQFMDILRTNI